MRFQIIAVVLAAATSSVLGAPVSTTEPVPVRTSGFWDALALLTSSSRLLQLARPLLVVPLPMPFVLGANGIVSALFTEYSLDASADGCPFASPPGKYYDGDSTQLVDCVSTNLVIYNTL
ncbi:hypothetical protein PIIN_03075 [Serendipita indica DSM 11827]|uniref:Uncharacterized protein n=1 Tax=Serendipita indica (strain DSM 11827) TaxID=1109443 RepID=G4TCX3_SERID|nr:hypothetical protein PIIN_03075 [Serendipita indica DSM 11827]